MSGPVWKKPEDVMKQMREKKKALQARFGHTSSSLPHNANNSNENCTSAQGPQNNSTGGPVKRKNPFKRSPVKKIRLHAVDPGPSEKLSTSPSDCTTENTLFKLLNGKRGDDCTKEEGIAPLPAVTQLLATSTEPESRVFNKCVVDWSLKTRVRFTSKTQFSCSSTLKTSEEASGITGFVRCVNSPCSEAWSSLDTSTNAQFHACCLYWQHPWLPWLSTFPRDTPVPVNSSSLSVNIGVDPKIASSLLNDWCESFRSLFGLLRARQCPFFYVLTHQFSILFRAAGIGGVAETHALLTPTTKGLREVIRAEDIAFSMPLRKNMQTTDSAESANRVDQSNENQEHDEDEGPDDDDEDDNEEEWINNIGLHSNLRSKLEAERLQDGGQGTTQGSYSDSLLLIEGVETQGLFNWLMTTKLCISNTGPLAGVPPTLLAPIAFHGATLRPLKVPVLCFPLAYRIF
nr:EOG090X09DI [Sida crystallina]